MANFYIKARWPRENSKWRTKWRPFSKWPLFKTCNHSLLPKTSQNWPICMVFVSNCMFMKSRNLNLHIFCLYFLFLVIFVPNVRRKRLLFVTNWLYCRSCWDTYMYMLAGSFFMLSIFIDVYLHICSCTVPCMEGWIYNTYIFHGIQSGSHTLLAVDSFQQLVVRLSIIFAKSYLAAANPID